MSFCQQPGMTPTQHGEQGCYMQVHDIVTKPHLDTSKLLVHYVGIQRECTCEHDSPSLNTEN